MFMLCQSNTNKVLKPTGNWDGKFKSFKFKIRGQLSPIHAADVECRRSIMSTVVYLNGALIAFSNVSQKHVTLSVTEFAAVVNMIQNIIYIYWEIMSMKLQVKLPMTAKMDNSRACDPTYSWSIDGRMRHKCSSCVNSRKRG